jgi:hypothetical protein
MKKVIYTLLTVGMLFVAGACVDDYTDSNPPHLLDAPTLRLSGEGSSNLIFSTLDGSNPYQKTYAAVVSQSGPSEFTVTVLDAPGKIGDISGSLSVPDFGEVVIDQASANALKGKETGTFKFTFEPSDFGPNYDDGSANIVITVSDTQIDHKGEEASLSTSLTIPITLRRCLSTGLATGRYNVIEASGVLDDGTSYDLDDINAAWEDMGGTPPFGVTIARPAPGRYTFNDITGGVWRALYFDFDAEVEGRNRPAVGLDLCGNSLSTHDELTTIQGTEPEEGEDDPFDRASDRKFFADLTVNDDGTIDVEWWYEVVGEEDPSESPAHGTYKLELPE